MSFTMSPVKHIFLDHFEPLRIPIKLPQLPNLRMEQDSLDYTVTSGQIIGE
jgi:hypothetical protein